MGIQLSSADSPEMLWAPDVNNSWRVYPVKVGHGEEGTCQLGSCLQQGHHHEGNVVPTPDSHPSSEGPESQRGPRKGSKEATRWGFPFLSEKGSQGTSARLLERAGWALGTRTFRQTGDIRPGGEPVDAVITDILNPEC